MMPADLNATVLPSYLAAGALIFGVTSVSLMRLKSLGVLTYENRNMTFWPQAENIAHSIGKVALVMFLSAALARIVIAPDYPGGVGRIDLAMIAGAAVFLLSAVPGVAVIVALSPVFKGQKISRTFLAAATIGSILANGAGQVTAAAVASGVEPRALLAVTPHLVPPILISGSVLTTGVAAHFFVVKKLTSQEGPHIRMIFQDAFLAAAPTLIALYAASIFVAAALAGKTSG